MSYTITLTEDEYKTLRWLADRGYDGSILDNSSGYGEEDGTEVLTLTEPQAWEVRDCVNDDPHAWLACCGDDGLAAKLNRFLESIV